MELLALAVAFAVGVDVRRLGVLTVAIYLPVVVFGLVAGVIWRAQRDTEARSALFCEGVASELRAGSPLRDALAAAGASVTSQIPTRHRRAGIIHRRHCCRPWR